MKGARTENLRRIVTYTQVTESQLTQASSALDMIDDSNVVDSVATDEVDWPPSSSTVCKYTSSGL
jgi:hypothetical protein